MARPASLTETEINAFLDGHRAWSRIDGALCRTYQAPSFLEGIAFVTQVAKLAEAADHHPDIDIRWRNITLRFVTHDAGNQISALDTRLAQECDALFEAHVRALVR
jgi:4a-hydroxytetrahydrobiopterin dehydratase